MQMRTGHPSSAPDLRDNVALLHVLSGTDEIHLIVSVNRNDPAAVAYNHNVSVAAELIAVNDFASFHRMKARIGPP